MNQEFAVEIQDLVKTFEGFTLGPLSLKVPAGAIYALIGPNGAGKTTTLDLMFGMGAPDSGEIRILGLDHARDEVEIKRQVAYMSHEFRYTRWKRVGHAVRFIRDFYPDWDHGLCEDLMRRFGLDSEDSIAPLSTGGQIKLALVLALSRRPRILVLDEPTSGLDPLARRELFSELLAAIEDGSRSVLISTHNLADVERFADHIGLIKNGELVAEGACDQLLESHRQIDFTIGGQVPGGAKLIEREGNRVRVISSSPETYVETLKSLGASQIRVQPLSLEELFVGLVGRD